MMVCVMLGRFALQQISGDASVLNSFIRTLSLTAQQNTVIVERWWQVPLSKQGRPPRLYGRRHRIYRLVEDTKREATGKMELLLTQTVPKLGGRGDTVFVKKSVGRNKLLSQGLAVYPSSENKEMFAEERKVLREGKREDRIQSRTGELTVKFLKEAELAVGVPTSVHFQLTKEVVCRRFLRTLGVVVPTEALTLQEEPITELGQYWCEVSVNGVDTVRVPLTVLPFEELRLKKLQKKLEEEQPPTAD